MFSDQTGSTFVVKKKYEIWNCEGILTAVFKTDSRPTPLVCVYLVSFFSLSLSLENHRVLLGPQSRFVDLEY